MAKSKDIEMVSLQTLREVLPKVIKDSKSKDPEVIASFIVDKFLSGLGSKGKIRKLPGSNTLEFFSPFATLDTEFWEGRRLFIYGE